MLNIGHCYRAQAAVLVRGVVRVRPVLVAPLGHHGTKIDSEIEYVLSLVDGVATAADRCARGEPFRV